MSKPTALLLAAVILELMLSATSVAFLRWSDVAADLASHTGAHRLDLVRLVIAFGAPIVLAAAMFVLVRWSESETPRRSAAQKGYGEAGVIAAAFFLVAYQAWFVSHLGERQIPHAGREVMLRASAIFAGMLLAVQGNFSAKTPVPSGQRAPDPSSWARVKLRSGWVLSIAGLVVALCAIMLPLGSLLAVLIVVGISVVAFTVAQHRQLNLPSAA